MALRKGGMILLLFVAVAAAITIPLVVLESRRTPDWHAALVRYFEVSERPLTGIQSVWAAEAHSVGLFPDERLIAVPTDWEWQGIDRIPPPDRVCCIRLFRQGASKSARLAPDERLLIGHHDDGLHHAGWIVHEFQAGVSQAEREALFVTLGCERWKRVHVNP